MLYACDLKWWDEYSTKVQGLQAERWTVDTEAQAKHGLHYIEGVHDVGLCVKAGRIFLGGNSGYQAVGLAHEWGARRVVLLGFDMQPTGGRQHWHPDHPASLGNGGNYEVWRDRFGVLARDLEHEGVEVVNATRTTALQCFKRLPLAAALGEHLLPLAVRGMQGLGDSIYQRPAIRELCKTRQVFLETAWPELYADLPVVPMKSRTHLRTQAKNVRKSAVPWGTPPVGTRHITLNYAGKEGTMLAALLDGVVPAGQAVQFDLPAFERPAREPYVVVRPATVRREWPAESRNPRPEYLARAAERLRQDFKVISVADLADGEEWAVGDLPPADERIHAGELSITELLGLVAGAAGVIGGVGWLVPAALALRVPMLLLYGGWGFHNGPARIFDPRLDTSLIHQVLPDRFCMCSTRDHGCNKNIARLDEHIERWAVGLAANRRPAVAA